MTIKIDQSILDRFGDVTIGAAAFELDTFSEKLAAYCAENQAQSAKELEGRELESLPPVQKWMGLFQAMNAKKGKESSVVFLTRYLMEHGSMFKVHPIVDLYNTVSIKFGLPMGAYDSEKFVGEVSLRQARKGEEFYGINARQAEKTSGGEVVYSDGAGVICRYWNDRDCERTKLTADTRKFVMIFDGVGDRDRIEEAIREVRTVLEDAKDFRYAILDRQAPRAEL